MSSRIPYRSSVIGLTLPLVVFALLLAVACESTSEDAANNPLPNGALSNDDSCVATGCDDGDPCTTDTCEAFAGRYSCRHRPVTCATGFACDPDSGTCVQCFADEECDDGSFCNGVEVCNAGACQSGEAPCADAVCDEVADACVECLAHSDCDDGLYCTGVETCQNNICVAGTAPCEAAKCDEPGERCLACLNNGECDDGLFCNGAETCVDGACAAGELPCPAACSEVLQTCGSTLTAKIIGCSNGTMFFDTPIALAAEYAGGFGERASYLWTVDADYASLATTDAETTELVIPQAENVVVRLRVTDETKVNAEWVQVAQASAECTISADAPLEPFEEAPISGALPSHFDADGGDFDLSISPVDRDGNLITDRITADNFSFVDVRIAKYGQEDQVVSLGKASITSLDVQAAEAEQHVTVAISLDGTGSMSWNDPQRLRVDASKALVDRLGEGDEAAALEFSGRYLYQGSGFIASRLLQDFTGDHGLLNIAFDKVDESGSTPFYDAIVDAVEHVAALLRRNGAVVILTDGEENASTVTTFDEAVDAAISTHIPIFPIGLGDQVDFAELQSLAGQTGGTFASARDPESLEALFHALGTAVTAGRVIVTTQLTFLTPITEEGLYTVTGSVETTIDERTSTSEFYFQILIGDVEIPDSGHDVPDLRGEIIAR